MEPITSGLLLATFCGTGLARSQLDGRFRASDFATGADQHIAAPYKIPTGQRPSASYAARSESILRLRKLKELTPGWDGSQASVPAERAIDTAEAFIQMLPAGLMTPRIGLAADGELGFFWEDESVYIDLSFAADGTISYFASTPQHGERGDEDIDLASDGYKDLVSMIPSAAPARLAA